MWSNTPSIPAEKALWLASTVTEGKTGLERLRCSGCAALLREQGRKLLRRPNSEQDPTKRPGAHSDYLHASLFRAFLAGVPFHDYDVMLECKAKDLALLKLCADLESGQE